MSNLYCEQVVSLKKKSFVDQLLFWRKHIEYEYFIGDGEMIIDVIYNNSRRKNKMKVLLSSAVELIQVTGEEIQRSNYNFTSGYGEKDMYALKYAMKGKPMQIIIEPNEELLRCLKGYIKV